MVAARQGAGHRRRLVGEGEDCLYHGVSSCFMLIPPWLREISSLCVAVIVLTTIYSGVEYFIKNLDVLSGTK